MQLRGTEINPAIVDDKIAQQEFNVEEKKKQKKVLAERLQQWTAFANTDQGRACADLADPNIKHLEYLGSLSMEEVMKSYSDLKTEAGIQEKRAEWRGQKRLWLRIKFDALSLQNELEKLNTDGKEEEKAQKSWQPAPK